MGELSEKITIFAAPNVKNFGVPTMNLDNIKQQAIAALGFDRLNTMQEQMLQTAMTGRDVLLLAPTGSGKTVAFLLPVREATLVVVPSRELAQQIADVSRRLHRGLRCVACYGGHDPRIEQQALAATPRPTIVVGTPGRLKDLAERGALDLAAFRSLVLDEYDKSLELGFEDEMKAIVGRMSGLRQRILTSATHGMLIAPYLGIKTFVTLDYTGTTRAAAPGPATRRRRTDGAAGQDEAATKESPDSAPDPEAAPRIELRQVKSPVRDKLETLHNLLCTLPAEAQAIVFAGYRESSERIAHYLADRGVACALYHGGMEQAQRDKALIRLRGQSIRVLVCTDLGARGLDIPEVGHVIHYHLPADQDACTHRNGRTARAGATGSAYFILGPDELLPAYVAPEPIYFNLRPSQRFAAAPYATIYIGRGRREKISRGDVLGFVSKQGGIDGADIGRIDVGEHEAYCAVRREVADDVVRRLSGLKIKGEKTHYLILK